MTATKLKKSVQQLGELRAQMTALKASERELTGAVVEAMRAGKLEQITSAGYAAQLTASRTLTLDVAKFRKKAGPKIFAACVRVDNKAARRHFSDAELEKLGTVAESVKLRISPRPGK